MSVIASNVSDATTLLPTDAKAPKVKVHPAIAAIAVLIKIGLDRSKDLRSYRATSYVAIAAMARKELGATTGATCVSGGALTALDAIGVIEKHSRDCLPGVNPNHVTIGEVFANCLGFAKDHRAARTSQIGDYIATL